MRRILGAMSILAVAACSEPTAMLTDAPLGGAADRNQAQANGASATRVYEIHIENLTGGQPLTPPQAAIHSGDYTLFKPNRAAGAGIQQVAENGNPTTLQGAWSTDSRIVSVGMAGGPVLPGGAVTFTIQTDQDARFLSWVSMLICTNDGFSGQNRVLLPNRVGQSRTAFTRAWDAGTEINTEDFADMVPPCPALTGVPSTDPGTGTTNPALAENGVVHHHRNIQGGDDLVPAIHAWDGPHISQVRITRIQ